MKGKMWWILAAREEKRDNKFLWKRRSTECQENSKKLSTISQSQREEYTVIGSGIYRLEYSSIAGLAARAREQELISINLCWTSRVRHYGSGASMLSSVNPLPVKRMDFMRPWGRWAITLLSTFFLCVSSVIARLYNLWKGMKESAVLGSWCQ